MQFLKNKNQSGYSTILLVILIVFLLVGLVVIYQKESEPIVNKLEVQTDNVSGNLQDQIDQARRENLGTAFMATEGEAIVLNGATDELRFEILSFLDGQVEYEFWINDRVAEFMVGEDAPDISPYSIKIISSNPEAVRAEVLIN